MKPQANKTLIFELVDAVLKSWWVVVAAVCMSVASAILVLDIAPKEYEATAKVLVIPQKIPKEFVRDTVTEDLVQRAAILKEAVIGEPYLRELVERVHGLPSTDEELQSMMSRVRSGVSVVPSVDPRMQVIAFDLIYRSGDQQNVAVVANTLAELFCEQNVESRASAAKQTHSTMFERALQAKANFETIDTRLAEFRAQHPFETERDLATNLSMMDGAKRDLDNNRNNQTLLGERRQDLQDRLDQLELTSASAPFSMRIARLQSLQAELDALLTRYSEAHPDVVRMRREIEDLRATLAEEQIGDDDPKESLVIPDPQEALLREEIADLDRRLEVLRAEESRLRGEITEYDRRIDAVATVQPQLTALLEEHAMLKKNYRDLYAKADRAKESQLIEEGLQGQQFELVKRAGFPKRPVAPIPMAIFGLSMVTSFLVFVGPLLIRRLLNPMIYSEAGLRALVDVPFLVSLPRVDTPRYKDYLARRFVKNLGFSVVFAAVLALVVLFVGRNVSAADDPMVQQPHSEVTESAGEQVSR